MWLAEVPANTPSRYGLTLLLSMAMASSCAAAEAVGLCSCHDPHNDVCFCRNSDFEDTAFEPAAELGAELAEAGAKPVPDSSGILASHNVPDAAVSDAPDAEVTPGSTGMAVPAISDAAALPEVSDSHTLPDIQAWSQASEAGAVPDDTDVAPMPERLIEHDSTVVDSVLADMQAATAAAVEEQQVMLCTRFMPEGV